MNKFPTLVLLWYSLVNECQLTSDDDCYAGDFIRSWEVLFVTRRLGNSEEMTSEWYKESSPDKNNECYYFWNLDNIDCCKVKIIHYPTTNILINVYVYIAIIFIKMRSLLFYNLFLINMGNWYVNK